MNAERPSGVPNSYAFIVRREEDLPNLYSLIKSAQLENQNGVIIVKSIFFKRVDMAVGSYMLVLYPPLQTKKNNQPFHSFETLPEPGIEEVIVVREPTDLENLSKRISETGKVRGESVNSKNFSKIATLTRSLDKKPVVKLNSLSRLPSNSNLGQDVQTERCDTINEYIEFNHKLS